MDPIADAYRDHLAWRRGDHELCRSNLSVRSFNAAHRAGIHYASQITTERLEGFRPSIREELLEYKESVLTPTEESASYASNLRGEKCYHLTR